MVVPKETPVNRAEGLQLCLNLEHSCKAHDFVDLLSSRVSPLLHGPICLSLNEQGILHACRPTSFQPAVAQ